MCTQHFKANVCVLTLHLHLCIYTQSAAILINVFWVLAGAVR